jgi:hypothetical protein
MTAAWGGDPDVARNRRHPGGPVDRALPVLVIRELDGRPIALVTSYACHPVVLDATNHLWTADYPHVVRREMEAAYPGAIALFLTGCTGDVNTGHSAHSSVSLVANPNRTFEAAERLGRRIAEAALAAPQEPVGDAVWSASREIMLEFQRRETEPADTLVARWRGERTSADPARAVMLAAWIDWAQRVADSPAPPQPARVTVIDWGGVPIVALPGEIFAETALSIRQDLALRGPAFVISYADDNPGYIPPAGEFAFGGYEVDEAHRYYGAPATFAPGSAEQLAAAAVALWRMRHS